MTASIVFVKFVVSSKSLEPYVIEIEEKSGVPTVVNQMTSKDLTGNEAVKSYFINQFIQAAAGYDPKTYRRDAHIVRLLSTQAIYADFRKRINARKLGIDTKIKPRIKSVQFISAERILVRALIETNSKVTGFEAKDYVMEMSFYFANLTLSEEERLINPLGFQVIQFSMVEERFDY
jgi:type IV secretion system protein VirB8